jgi:hypothetical protein
MNRSIMLIGQPDSGKTNYLARVWESLRAEDGMLKLVDATDIQYLEEVIAHLLQGEYAPRSDKNIEESKQDITLTVRQKNSDEEVDLLVPDVTGELWRGAVSNLDLPQEWMTRLENSDGALLFLRVGSDENHQPIDWVTSRRLMALVGNDAKKESVLPTQVLYSELLRFLQLKLTSSRTERSRRVAVVVSAWDRLDPEQREATPLAYLRKEYPLFAGRLENLDDLEIRLFGLSITGGDLQDDPAFKATFQNGDLKDFGYTVITLPDGTIERSPDLTLPINWLVEA